MKNKRLIKDVVYERLLNDIIIGKLKPRERIRELELAEKFSCSQAPIREVLQTLDQEGLVEQIPYTGTFVTDIHYEEMKELFEYRKMIELNALKKAMFILSNEDIAQFTSFVEKMKEAGKNNDMAQIVYYDMAFHRSIIEKARKKVSLSIWLKLDIHVRRFIAYAHPKYFDHLEEIALAHEPLIEALKSGDIQKAEEAFSTHINIEEIIEQIQF